MGVGSWELKPEGGAYRQPARLLRARRLTEERRPEGAAESAVVDAVQDVVGADKEFQGGARSELRIAATAAAIAASATARSAAALRKLHLLITAAASAGSGSATTAWEPTRTAGTATAAGESSASAALPVA